MLNVMREYLAECQRQRTTPYEGFVNHLSTNTIDCDLDAVPVNAIRIFGMALRSCGSRSCSRGSGAAPSLTASSLRGSSPRHHNTARPFASKEATACTKTASSFPSRGRQRSATDAAAAATGGEDSDRAGGGRLVCLRLRCGRGQPARPGERAVPKKTSRPFGAALPPPSPVGRTAGAAITSPAHRSALRVLVDGVRCAVEDSSSCLSTFQFSGFPLSEVGESGSRLLRSLARCPALRSLSLGGSSLSPELLAAFTTFSLSDAVPRLQLSLLPPVSFPSLTEADLSGCGLGDKCLRPILFLISLNKERAGLARWQRSLRAEGGSALSPSVHTGAGAATSSTRGLERLDLSENALGDAALMGIARVTRDDSTLRTLNMSRNQVTVNGLYKFLASGALENSGLDVVDLSRNPCCYQEHSPPLPGEGGGYHPTGGPPLLPQLPFHQCIAGGLGQLLILRHRAEDHPASKRARRIPGQLSLQTGSEEETREVPSAQGEPRQAPQHEQASPLRGTRGSTPAAPILPPFQPEQQQQQQQQQQQDDHSQPSGAASSPVSPGDTGGGDTANLSNTFGPSDNLPQQQQQQQQMGHGATQYYPLPPSTYILPVYQPFPPPNLFAQSPQAQAPPPPHRCCCPHCCPHCPQSHEHHRPSEASGSRQGGPHPHHHHHHNPGDTRKRSGAGDRPPPYSAGSRYPTATDRNRSLEEPSTNAISELTSPADRSFTEAATGVGSAEEEEGDAVVAPASRHRHRHHRHRQAVSEGSWTPPPHLRTNASRAEPQRTTEREAFAGHSHSSAHGGEEGQGGASGLYDPVLDGSEEGAGSETAATAAVAMVDAGNALTATVAPSQLGRDSEGEIDAIASAVAHHVQNGLRVHLQRQESLVERMVHELDNHELELTEKLEKHHQQSTTRLDILRKELLARLEKLSTEQQAAAAAAAKDRELALEEKQDALAKSGVDEHAEEAGMERKLVDLMQFLMKQIQARVERASRDDDEMAEMAEKVREQQKKVGGLLRPSSATAASQGGDTRSETMKRQELIAVANTQLKALGW